MFKCSLFCKSGSKDIYWYIYIPYIAVYGILNIAIYGLHNMLENQKSYTCKASMYSN